MKNSLLRLSVFLSLVLFFQGCSELYDSPAESVQWEQPPGITISVEKLQSAMNIQDRVTDALFRNPEVVGTGTGVDENGNPAIVVYTLSKVEQRADVTIENVGTGERPTALPVSIDSLPVIPKVTGMFKAYADPTSWFERPVPIGVSTGHPDITAGTIGCRVKDDQGNVYALSNNHVYANINDASTDDNVLQPGTYDGGIDPADAIGTLYDFEPIDFSGINVMDAAIALCSPVTLGTSTPSDADAYGIPGTTTVDAAIGLNVEKYGRTTGSTFGAISETNVIVDVWYKTRGPFKGVKSARFEKQMAITPGTFSDGGDSGSLIVTEDENSNPVGLLFAGSSTHTIANPIGVVLTRFGVTIDDGSGGTGNAPPLADFSYTTTELTVYFTDQSSDPDGSIISWNWDFGDNNTSAEKSPTYPYTTSGTYTVILTVTDDAEATGSTSQDVTVPETSGGGITLTADGYKVKGIRYVDLEWSGATGNVDIYRNSDIIGLDIVIDGAYIDDLGRNNGTFTYQVCETGSSVLCSNEATVIF